MVKEGNDAAILSIGHIGNEAVKAIKILEEKGKSVALYDMRFAKPLDEVMLHNIFSKHTKIVTVEDGCISGGFGSAISEFMIDHNYTAEVIRLGMPDRVVEHGEQPQLWSECGYDHTAIAKSLETLLHMPVSAGNKTEPLILN